MIIRTCVQEMKYTPYLSKQWVSLFPEVSPGVVSFQVF